MKVKSHVEGVDQPSAKVTLATVKNKTKQAKFATIGCHTQPVVTGWESWLNGAIYYAKNSPEVKGFEGYCILVTQAKVSLQTTGLATQLLKLQYQYECVVKLIEMMESAKYINKKAAQAIQELDFREDTCSINPYIQKRMQNNHISEVMNMKRPYIS